MIQKAYKFKIKPTKEQEILIRKSIGSGRFVYNWALDKRITLYKTDKTSIRKFDLMKYLSSNLKEEYEWLKEVPSQGLQASIINLDNAYKRFFTKKGGFPKFKSKRNGGSFSFPQLTKVDFENKQTFLPKIGWIKLRGIRKFEGTIKTSTITLTPTGKFYISILVETPDFCKECYPIEESTTIGIDLGIKDFATLSNGDKIENPKYLREFEKKLKKKQRQLSKKKKVSSNRRKASVRYAKLHEKIRNKKIDFLHKFTHKLTHNNQVRTIVLEDLNVAGMVRNHKLAKSISDASWSTFITFLTYKCKWNGVNLLFIGRFEPSSKLCSVCGGINEHLTLKDRHWICEQCNNEHDRDINAAINIKNFALIKQNIGQELPDFKPAETITSDFFPTKELKLCL